MKTEKEIEAMLDEVLERNPDMRLDAGYGPLRPGYDDGVYETLHWILGEHYPSPFIGMRNE